MPDMSGYYPPGNNVPLQYYTVHQHAPPNPNPHSGAPLPRMIPDPNYGPPGIPENPFQPGITGSFVQYIEPHMHSEYGDMYDDVSAPPGSAQAGSARVRQRGMSGDHVKHRRTRSGCFTCRQRRVKVNALLLSDWSPG